MLAVIFSMSMFALVGAITPGPVNMLATSYGARFGFWRALPHVLGASLGYALLLLVLGAGADQVIARIGWLQSGIQWAGALFLLYLALRIILAPVGGPVAEGDCNGQPGIWQGALCQWLNPKAWLFGLSGIGLFVSSAGALPSGLYVFSTVSFLVCCFSVGCWAAMGQVISRHLHNALRQRCFNVLMGSVLVLTVALAGIKASL
ncbi:LysE family translocator [Pokkaliibacter plantistimulans]|nr:LysE family translocator [Pokkaliibacter plantistimulans]